MKRIFSVEWCDDYGEMWMNIDNLESCLFSETHIKNVQVVVEDITDQHKKEKQK